MSKQYKWYTDDITNATSEYKRYTWYYPGAYIKSILIKKDKSNIDKIIDYLIKNNYSIPGIDYFKYEKNKSVILKNYFIKFLNGKIKLDPPLEELLLNNITDTKCEEYENDGIEYDNLEIYKRYKETLDKSEAYHWSYIQNKRDLKFKLKFNFLNNHTYADWSRLERAKKQYTKKIKDTYFYFRRILKSMKKESEKLIKLKPPVLKNDIDYFIDSYVNALIYKAYDNIESADSIDKVILIYHNLKDILLNPAKENSIISILPSIFNLESKLSDLYSNTINDTIVNEYNIEKGYYYHSLNEELNNTL